MHYVISFDRKTAVRTVEEIEDAGSAIERRFALERSRASDDVEVVVISAPSLDVVKKTHPRYFRGDRKTPRRSALGSTSVEVIDARMRRYA